MKNRLADKLQSLFLEERPKNPNLSPKLKGNILSYPLPINYFMKPNLAFIQKNKIDKQKGRNNYSFWELIN